MKFQDMPYTDRYAQVMDIMTSRGLLLGAYDKDGKPNAMTIGWGSIGSIWGMPVWIVLVRPSRYTYGCIEHSDCFSVCVPGRDLATACAICGSKSGRDSDKLATAGLTAQPGSIVHASIISHCPIVYECQVMHRNDIIPSELVKQLQEGPYASGDYHRLYYGAIVAARVADDVAQRLG